MSSRNEDGKAVLTKLHPESSRLENHLSGIRPLEEGRSRSVIGIFPKLFPCRSGDCRLMVKYMLTCWTS